MKQNINKDKEDLNNMIKGYRNHFISQKRLFKHT